MKKLNVIKKEIFFFSSSKVCDNHSSFGSLKNANLKNANLDLFMHANFIRNSESVTRIFYAW